MMNIYKIVFPVPLMNILLKLTYGVQGILFLVGIHLLAFESFAQQQIKGYVYDKYNNPIESVTINKDGKQTQTDSVGAFTLSLSVGDVLILKKKDFLDQEYKYRGEKNIQISLIKDLAKSQVNIAYGKQEFRELTAAISSITGEDLYDIQVQNLSTAINGRLNGLTVQQASSEPGSEFPSFNIRGLGSYSGSNNPLIYVDGFESTYDHLLSLEIETINVFKDAAALAPFGIRGANGVIWATTKRGTVGKTRIALQTRTGVSRPTQLPSFLDAYDYARLYNEAQSNDRGRVWTPLYSEADLNAYRNGSDPLFRPNINWYNEVLKEQVPNFETNLSFNGGTNTVKYFVILGALNTPKLFKDNPFEKDRLEKTGATNRYNFRSNVDVNLNKVFDVSVDIGGAILDRSFPNYDNFFSLLAATPPNVYAPINPDGSWGGNSIYPNNPVASLFALGQRNTNARTLQTNFTLREKLDMVLPGLSLNQSISFLSYFQGNYNYVRNYARFSPVKDPLTNQISYTQFGNNTPYSINESQYSQYRRNSYAVGADYEKQFGENKLTSMLTYRYSNFITGGNNVPFTTAGLAGRFAYNYANTYFAEFNYAYNGSDNFAKGNRYGFFPAISGGWLISNESFLKNSKAINFLKLRASAGIVGNDDIAGSRFLYQGYYPTGPNYILGNNGTASVGTRREGVIGNPDISWEKSYMYNAGIDARFFNHQLQVSADYFFNRRKDILSTRGATAPSILGIGLPFENLGETTVKGLEIGINYTKKISSFEYYFGSNFSFARSKIINQEEIIRSQPYLYRTGQPVGQPFGLTAIGFFQSQEEIDDPNTPRQLFGPVQPGDVRYKDQNKDGFINEDDETALGYSATPEISGSFNLGLKYKGFDIDALLYGVANRTLYLNGPQFWAFVNNSQVPAFAEGRWAYYPDQGIDTRATATYPRLTLANSDNNFRSSTLWRKSGDFLRLRNLEFGYTVPRSAISKFKIEGIRLYLSATNLLTFSGSDDYDPEFPTGYPLMKNYQFGLNVRF